MKLRNSTSALWSAVTAVVLVSLSMSACSTPAGEGGEATAGSKNASATGTSGATALNSSAPLGSGGKNAAGGTSNTANQGTDGTQTPEGIGGKQATTENTGGRRSAEGGTSSGNSIGGTHALDTGGGAGGNRQTGVGSKGNTGGAANGGAGGSTTRSSAATTKPVGTGGIASTTKPVGTGGAPIPVKDLPVIKEMPDPLTMNDGTKVTTVEQWKTRRQEMIEILEDYEYGHMPPPPGNVKATTATASQQITVGSGLKADYRMLHLTFGPGEKLGFDLGLFTPIASTGAATKYPVLVSLTYGASKTSIADASAAFSRGYAVATVPYQQLGADASNWASTAFFSSYPEYDWRDISAWAWGISRAVDYLVTDPSIDPEKILITGVSRLGQAVLVAGAFDERIALSAPVAGGMAFRYSGKEMGGGLGQGITEVVDQVTYWFGPRFPEFKNKTTRLPCDQHWLPALTAPRLFIMCNSLQDEYGRAYAAVQTYLAAKPVYEFLDAADNLGVHFRPGGHGMTTEDWSAVLDFADQYLLKKGGTKRFDELPPASETP